jgi:putative nucleotidyltransferase with HDIG domain
MIKRIHVDRLRQGMFVTELDRPWIETPFLFSRFLIKSPQQIAQLRKYCHTVQIDTAKGVDEDPGTDAVQGGSAGPEPPRRPGTDRASGHEPDGKPFPEVIQEALEVRTKTKQVVDHMLEDVRLGRSIDSDEARQAVENVMENITRNQEALICLTQLKNRDEYTSIHSMNVCVLCIAFARHLGLNDNLIRVLGMGALLHDLGKMRVPLEILNKPGKLTAEEFEVMKGHVLLGAEILQDTPGIPPGALKVVLEHHERYKGGGYPHALREDQISWLGQLSAIADVYDAITSDRVYHSHLPPHEAVKRMYAWSQRDFNVTLMEKFIKCIGIYPLGSAVEINAADIGFVVSYDGSSALKPDVLLVMDARRNRYPVPHKISMTEKAKDMRKDKWVITRVLDAAEEDIRLDSFIQLAP